MRIFLTTLFILSLAFPGQPQSFTFFDQPWLNSIAAKPATDITTGLVAWYKFNGDGTDSSGNGYNLTAIGSPTYTTGANGFQCAVLNGSSQYFNYTGSYGIGSGITNWSITAWVYPTTLASGPDYHSQRHIINVALDGIGLIEDNSGTWTTYYRDGTGTYWSTSNNSDYTSNVWHFLAATMDGTNYVLTVDGNIVTTGASAQNSGLNTSTTGIGNDTTGARLFQGNLQDLRIYNRRLLSTEVSTLNANGAK